MYVMTIHTYIHTYCNFSEKLNLNVSKPSEHSPVRGIRFKWCFGESKSIVGYVLLCSLRVKQSSSRYLFHVSICANSKKKRGVTTTTFLPLWYLRGLNRRSTTCLFSSLVWAARSGARVQHLPKLKAVPRYGSARIYHGSTPQTCARYKM